MPKDKESKEEIKKKKDKNEKKIKELVGDLQ